VRKSIHVYFLTVIDAIVWQLGSFVTLSNYLCVSALMRMINRAVKEITRLKVSKCVSVVSYMIASIALDSFIVSKKKTQK